MPTSKTNFLTGYAMKKRLKTPIFLLIILFVSQSISFAEQAVLSAGKANNHLAPALNMADGAMRRGYLLLQGESQDALNHKLKLTEENSRILQEQIIHKNNIEQLAEAKKRLHAENNRLEDERKKIIAENKKDYDALTKASQGIKRNIKRNNSAAKKNDKEIKTERVKKEYKHSVRGSAKRVKQTFRNISKATRTFLSYLMPLAPKEKELRLLRRLIQGQEKQKEAIDKNIEILNSKTKQITVQILNNTDKIFQTQGHIEEFKGTIKNLKNAYERNLNELKRIQAKEFFRSEKQRIKQKAKPPEFLPFDESAAKIEKEIISKFIIRSLKNDLAVRLSKVSRESPLENFAQVLAGELELDPENRKIIDLIVKKIQESQVDLAGLYNLFQCVTIHEPWIVGGYKIMTYDKINKDLSTKKVLEQFRADVLGKMEEYVLNPEKYKYRYKNVLKDLNKIVKSDRRSIFRVIETEKKIVFVTHKQRGELGSGSQYNRILAPFTSKNLDDKTLLKQSVPFCIEKIKWRLKNSDTIAFEADQVVIKKVKPLESSAFLVQQSI